MNKERVKTLLLTALHYAVEWEESKLDAGTDMGDKAEIREMRANIRAFNKMRAAIDANRPMTLREYLNSLPESSFLTLDEIKERATSRSNVGEGK